MGCEAEAGDSLEDPDDDSDGVSLISQRTLSLYDTYFLLRFAAKTLPGRGGGGSIIIDTERVGAGYVPAVDER
jgi:hypothetical protein